MLGMYSNGVIRIFLYIPAKSVKSVRVYSKQWDLGKNDEFNFHFIWVDINYNFVFIWYLCLVLLQVPNFFVLVQIFCASPKIWLHLVPLQKLLCWHKNQFYWMQIIFLSGTKCLWLPQYVNKFLVWHKKFGPAQNILGPVKGQGICF